MIGFSQIDELEIEREGAGKENGALGRKRMDEIESDCGVAGGFFFGAACFRIAPANGPLPQRFHMCEQVIAFLFAQKLRPATYRANGHRDAAELLSDRRFELRVRRAAATSFRDSTTMPSYFDYARWPMRRFSGGSRLDCDR